VKHPNENPFDVDPTIYTVSISKSTKSEETHMKQAFSDLAETKAAVRAYDRYAFYKMSSASERRAYSPVNFREITDDLILGFAETGWEYRIHLNAFKSRMPRT